MQKGVSAGKTSGRRGEIRLQRAFQAQPKAYGLNCRWVEKVKPEWSRKKAWVRTAPVAVWLWPRDRPAATERLNGLVG